MFADRVLYQAEVKVRRVGASAARSASAAAMGLVAVGFLTTALWIFLSQEFSALAAALSIGLLYALGAVILIVQRPRKREPTSPPKVGVDDLLHAFLIASQVGRSARRQ